MPVFKIYIRTGNAAFEDDKGAELARILRKIADDVERNGVQWHYQTILDLNGNAVGRYAEKDEE